MPPVSSPPTTAGPLSELEPLWPSAALEAALAKAALNFRVHYFPTVGSTNDEARRLAEAGAPQGTLVLADEQTAGRGRAGRRWTTPAGKAIAVSVILRPRVRPERLGALTMLGGVAVARALEVIYGLAPRLKWPNDVLLSGRKVAGILVEAAWSADHLDYAVIGIGVNVRPGSAPPEEMLAYPATVVEAEAQMPVDRPELCAGLLLQLDSWYAGLMEDALSEAWSSRLAFRDQPVRVVTTSEDLTGIARGVDRFGAFLLEMPDGEMRRILAGEIHLRPV